MSEKLLKVNPLSANVTKWSNKLKQLVDNSRRIAWVCLTIASVLAHNELNKNQ